MLYAEFGLVKIYFGLKFIDCQKLYLKSYDKLLHLNLLIINKYTLVVKIFIAEFNSEASRH